MHTIKNNEQYLKHFKVKIDFLCRKDNHIKSRVYLSNNLCHRRQWNIFKVLKENVFEPGFLHLNYF